MQKRPTSAVGYKRPISQHAQVVSTMGVQPRYRVSLHWCHYAKGVFVFWVDGVEDILRRKDKSAWDYSFKKMSRETRKIMYWRACMSYVYVYLQAENIMFLELDMSPPNTALLEHQAEAEPNQSHSMDSSPAKNRGVPKSQSWWGRSHLQTTACSVTCTHLLLLSHTRVAGKQTLIRINK